MVESKYLGGGLNLDDSYEVLDPQDWFYARNMVSGRASDSGEAGFAENIRGTNSISTVGLLDATHECIGVIRSRKKGDAFLFYCDTSASKNHTILKYAKGGTLTKVLVSSILGFDVNYKITGGGIVGDLLFFTDGLNEPRCVHTTRYADGTVTPVAEDITLARRPPSLPLSWTKHTTESDSSAILSDNVQYDDFQFAYQYFYEDKQYSVLSPFSSLVNKNVESESYKRIRLTIQDEEDIPALVNKIKLCARKGNNGVWFYIGELKRYDTDQTLDYDVDDEDNEFQSTSGVYNVTQASETGTLMVTGTSDLVPHHYVKYLDLDTIHSVDIKVYLPTNINCDQLDIYTGEGDLIQSVTTLNSWVTVTYAMTKESSALRFVMKDASATNPELFDASVDNFYVASVRRYSTEAFRRTFDFYNTNAGAEVPTSYWKPFDAVPQKASAMEVIKSRLWLGNYTEGYDRPESVDIVLSDQNTAINSTNYAKNQSVYIINKVDSSSGSAMITILGYYVPGDYGRYLPVDYDHSTYVAGTTVLSITGAAEKFVSRGAISYDLFLVTEDALVDHGDTATPTTFDGEKTFSNNSSYQVGILFSDFAGRKCTVYTRDKLRVDIPEDLSYSSGINWRLLSNVGIPSWADSYSILISKNLRKRYFIEHKSLDLFYYRLNTDDSESTATTYSPNYQYIKIDVSGLTYAGLGYEYEDGDRIFLRDPTGGGSNVDLPIVGFDGTYILCDNKDIGTIANTEVIFEIYKPVKGEAETLFYEIGQTYKIVSGEFSVKSGIIQGDCVNITRSTFTYDASDNIVDASNDTLFKAVSIDGRRDDFQWNTDAGRGFVSFDIGQSEKEQYVKHSGVYIADTEINGLCEFEALDEAAVPIENGAIKKLQSTTRVSSEGDVLLAICENETSSIYIGELNLETQTNTSFLINTTSVIGEIRTTRGGFGTANPESVLEYNGNVFWFCKDSRQFVRYATNGIEPISEAKVVDYFEDQAGIVDATFSVVCGFDPFYKMLFVTFFSASSSEKKTIGFSLTKRRWESFYDFSPEYYFSDTDKLVYVNGTGVYTLDNESTYCNFEGTQYNAEIDFSFNQSPNVPKEWKVIKLMVDGDLLQWSGGEQSVITDGLYCSFSNRHGQATDIEHDEFTCNEYQVYGTILCDSNSTGGLLNGEPMASETLQAKIRMKASSYIKMLFAEVHSQPSSGHRFE